MLNDIIELSVYEEDGIFKMYDDMADKLNQYECEKNGG